MQRAKFPITVPFVAALLLMTPALSSAADDAKEAHLRGVELYHSGEFVEASRAFRGPTR